MLNFVINDWSLQWGDKTIENECGSNVSSRFLLGEGGGTLGNETKRTAWKNVSFLSFPRKQA